MKVKRNLVYKKETSSVKNVLNELDVYNEAFKLPFNYGVIPFCNEDNTYNSKKMSMGKYETLQYLKAQGIKTIEATTDRKEAEHYLKMGYTVVKKHNKELSYINNPIDLGAVTGKAYYSKYIPGEEYRVFVLNKKSYDLSVKVPNGNLLDVLLTKNTKYGWVYRREFPFLIGDKVELFDAATWVSEALDAHFVAIDFIFYNGNSYVLECNYAPGMGPETAHNFVQQAREMGLLKHGNL